MTGLLLDTHAAIWLVDGVLDQESFALILDAGRSGQCFVSPVTAWEIGLLTRARRTGPAPRSFLPDAQTWYATMLAGPVLRETALTSRILIASSQLPGTVHGDPADRMLIATARINGLQLMTRDRKILDYASAGHVRAVEC